MLFKEYLANEAYFPSPPPNYSKNSHSEVNDVEVGLVQNQRRPTTARRDVQIVDSLICVLEDHIGNMEVPAGLIKLDFVRSYIGNAHRKICNQADVSMTGSQTHHDHSLTGHSGYFNGLRWSFDVFSEYINKYRTIPGYRPSEVSTRVCVKRRLYLHQGRRDEGGS